MTHFVESIFYHEGLKCCITFSPLGHRCGYVGVDETHPLFKVDYSNLDLNLIVHGGITHSNNNSHYPILQIKPLWWFGFDCAHYGDAKDWSTLEEKFPSVIWKPLWEMDKDHPFFTCAVVCTNEYVKQECCRLAEQLESIK